MAATLDVSGLYLPAKTLHHGHRVQLTFGRGVVDSLARCRVGTRSNAWSSPPTIGAFNDREALERFHRRAAHVQDDLHGIPSLPQQGLGAQARTQVRNRFA